MLFDDDGALTQAFTLSEISLADFPGTTHKEKGIHFELCPPQGHSAHGWVERRIWMLWDCLEKLGMKNSCSTATGWQTIAKAIEHQVNEVPLGYLYEDSGDGSPLLQLLRPNLLHGLTSN